MLQSVGTDRDSESTGDAARIAARVRMLQLDAIDGSAPSAVANLPAIIGFAFVIRHVFPAAELLLWIGAAIVVLAGLIAYIADVLPVQRHLRDPSKRLLVHSAFAGLVGALWGAAALAFGPGLGEGLLLVFTIMVLACDAACISGIGSYLPAFFGYCAASIVPLAIALSRRPEAEAHTMAYLLPLYVAVIGSNAYAYNRQVLSAFRLRAENEALAENLAHAHVETDEARRSKWDTLAHLSHELRTPMNAIMGFSQMMREELFGALSERYRDYSTHIHDSGRHMVALIDTILDVSRAETGNLAIAESDVDPVALIEESLHAVKQAADEKGLTLTRQIMAHPPCLTADPIKLRQALRRLLDNAVAYTREGGRIAVSLFSDADGLTISVTDTGVGIAEADLARCLEPFERVGNPLIAGTEGAGLGLPLARRIVEAHGGTLELVSEPGHGTIATMHLPVARFVWREEERKRA